VEQTSVEDTVAQVKVEVGEVHFEVVSSEEALVVKVVSEVPVSITEEVTAEVKNSSVVVEEVYDVVEEVCVPDITLCENVSEGEPGIELAIPSNWKAREKLVAESRSDPSIKHLRKLADRKEQGYSWSEGLVLKTRLDTLGRP